MCGEGNLPNKKSPPEKWQTADPDGLAVLFGQEFLMQPKGTNHELAR
jgi:hypothetical protein